MAYKTGQQLIDEAKSHVTQIAVAEAMALHEGGSVVYLDVREPNEWNLGRVPRAVHLPRGQIEGKVEGLLDRNSKVVVYCAHGNRSALAASTLGVMGYEAVSLAGGFAAWVDAGGEIAD